MTLMQIRAVCMYACLQVTALNMNEIHHVLNSSFRKSKYGRCWQGHLEFQSQIIKVMYMYLYFCPHAQYPIFE